MIGAGDRRAQARDLVCLVRGAQTEARALAAGRKPRAAVCAWPHDAFAGLLAYSGRSCCPEDLDRDDHRHGTTRPTASTDGVNNSSTQDVSKKVQSPVGSRSQFDRRHSTIITLECGWRQPLTAAALQAQRCHDVTGSGLGASWGPRHPVDNAPTTVHPRASPGAVVRNHLQRAGLGSTDRIAAAEFQPTWVVPIGGNRLNLGSQDQDVVRHMADIFATDFPPSLTGWVKVSPHT